MVNRKVFCALLLAASLLFGSAANSSAFVSGDVDDDGVVRLADFLLAYRFIAGNESLTSFQKYVCDVFGGGGPLPSPDGRCDLTDAILILKKANGTITF